VDIRITPKGKSFDSLVRDANRKLKTANRKLAGPVSRAGVKAIKSGAPTFAGRQLTAKTEVHNSGDGARITFYGVSAGAWAIKETGAKAHVIKPKRARALAFPGAGGHGGKATGYAKSANHKGVRGRRLWTQAGDRLEGAVGPVIEDVYDEAFD
jgi:hypothetical protein